MLRDLVLAANAACSKEDRKSLIPIVKQLQELSGIHKKRGLLALEDEQKNQGSIPPA